MSSILKALKRLEQQKMVRKNEEHDIAWIVRGEDIRSEKKRQWPMFVALVAVAALTALSTYWFMGGFHGATRDSLPGPGEEVRSSSGSRPETVLAPSDPSRPVTPPVSTHDIATNPPAVVSVPAEKHLVRPSETVTLKRDREGGEGQTIVPPQPSQSALPPRPEPVPAAVAPRSSVPTLTVTGIAGEKDSPVRLAIVNGTSVVEGSVVNGVKVEKILPDRVRFSYENRYFDVPLNRGDGIN